MFEWFKTVLFGHVYEWLLYTLEWVTEWHPAWKNCWSNDQELCLEDPV